MQSNILIATLLGLVVGGVLTYSFVAQTQQTNMLDQPPVAHDHMDDDHAHSHGETVGADATNPPELTIESARISGGNNVDISVSWENFTMAPENADGEHVDGEGHLHVYVDGHKIGRMYGQWYHVFALNPGEHEIEVSATTNDHKIYIVDGQPVAATTSVTIK
ncbi:MAG: hypothetical protein WD335_03520 [Candidatus Paceibacterota bacterium]